MSERARPQAPLFAKALLILVVLMLFLPLTMMVVSSFLHLTPEGIWQFTFKYFVDVFEDPTLGEALLNSIFVAISASSAAVIIGSFAALALAKADFIGSSFLRLSAIMSLVFPEIVFALSLLSLFFVSQVQLSLWTVIAAHISFSLPYVILTVGARANALDKSLDDAAKDLGASDWTLMTKVHFPLLKPAIVSSFFLSFLLSFDDFLITFFVNGVGSDTLPIKLYTSMKTGITPKLNALATLMFVATFVALILASRTSAFRATLSNLTKDEQDES